VVWTIPSFGPFLTALGSIARVVCLSDPLTVDRLPTPEARVADALTVMEAAGSERPVLFGMDSTGPLAIFFAATYPERTAALILFGTFACGLQDEEYPRAWSVEEWEAHDREVEERWWTTRSRGRSCAGPLPARASIASRSRSGPTTTAKWPARGRRWR
jgi:pimeloyl-ACP methyl ester carboxylesterase